MTSLLLRPLRLDPSLMFLYDNGGGSDEGGKNSEGGSGFSGGNFASNQCRSLMMAHAAATAASLAPSSSAYSLSSSSGDTQLASAVGEPAKQCSPCSAAQNSSSASLPYGGYFGGAGGGGGGGYYQCRVPHHHSGLKPCATQPPSTAHYADKYGDAPPCEDAFGPRPKDFAFYSTTAATSYPAGPYQPVPGSYLEVPVAPAPPPPEARHHHHHHHHEPLLPVDSYAPWGLSAAGGWGGPVYCPGGKEQTHSGHMWKSPGPDSACHPTGDSGSYRRGRKKRVPYTKVQLKELEREYAANKFITKDKRRRISAQTNLSERQVTIWFQNRRVKEKKVVNKVKSVS